jgi:hypothetical protein
MLKKSFDSLAMVAAAAEAVPTSSDAAYPAPF